MSLDLPALSLAELAWRVALRFDAGDWLVLVAPTPDSIRPAAQEVEEDLRVQEIPVYRASNLADAESLIAAAKAQPRCVLVLSELDELDDAQWRRLDLRRDELRRSACVIALLLQPTLQRLLTSAPNLASWISGSLWRLSPLGEQLSAEETEQRLAALRQRFHRTDEEVLHLAREQRLPRDPEFGEWLILLDRGDLL